MLEAKTEEQKKKVLEILGTQEAFCYFPLDLDKETDWGYEEFGDRIYLDGNITFDTMAEIVDYLRKENEEVDIPTTCHVSADSDGVVFDLRDTPHDEVMQFCENLAWVKGGSFDYYYGQFVKTGEIRL